MKRLLLILILAGGCGVVALGWSARNPLSGKPKRLCVILSGSQERKAAAHREAGRGTRSVASQRNVLADSNGEAHRKCRLGQSGVCHPCRAAIARDPVGQRAQAQDCKRPNGQREVRPAISQDMTPKAAIRLLDKAQRDVPRKPSTNTAASAAGDALWAALGDYEITAYCPCERCCGKFADHITADGTDTRTCADHIVAAPPGIPFGAVLYVEGFGRVVVHDRGGAIQGKRLDLFYSTHQAALAWGKVTRRIWRPVETDGKRR